MKVVHLKCPNCNGEIFYKNYWSWVWHTPFHHFAKRYTKCPVCGERNLMSREKDIKTTNWLIKGISEEQLAYEKQLALKDNKIECLQAKVESLQKANESFADMGKMFSEIKAEAYKEFAELLKKHSYYDPKDQRKVVSETIIDFYLKIMVGDK